MRGALVSVVVFLAGAGAVGAAGWSLQTATLPPPDRASRVAADVSTWLREYHYSIDIFHSHDRRLRGSCLSGWFPRSQGAMLRPGVMLALGGRTVVLDTGRKYLRFVVGRQRPDFPASLAIAAGCTTSLGNALYAATRASGDLSVERAYAANQPALALHLPPVRDERLTIYVSPRKYRPLVAIAAAEGRTATARLYLVRATLPLRKRYRDLLTGRRGTAS